MLTWDVIQRIGLEAGVKPDAVRKWKERRKVPHRWRPEIVERAAAAGVVASFRDFDKLPKAA